MILASLARLDSQGLVNLMCQVSEVSEVSRVCPAVNQQSQLLGPCVLLRHCGQAIDPKWLLDVTCHSGGTATSRFDGAGVVDSADSVDS